MAHAGHVLGQERGVKEGKEGPQHRAKVPYFYYLSCSVVASWAKGMCAGFLSDP